MLWRLTESRAPSGANRPRDGGLSRAAGAPLAKCRAVAIDCGVHPFDFALYRRPDVSRVAGSSVTVDSGRCGRIARGDERPGEALAAQSPRRIAHEPSRAVSHRQQGAQMPGGRCLVARCWRLDRLHSNCGFVKLASDTSTLGASRGSVGVRAICVCMQMSSEKQHDEKKKKMIIIMII